MDKVQFINRLKRLGLNKKEFAVICKVSYSTVNAWGSKANDKILPVPAWIEPFLNYFEKSNKLDYVMKEICGKIQEYKELS